MTAETGWPRGVYLPLVTPFVDGEVDHESLRRLLARYKGSGIAGLVLLGTTGESPVLSDTESEQVVEAVAGAQRGALPLYLGISGNDTRSVAAAVRRSHRLPVTGFLVTAPYYNRPTQAGLVAHFDAVVGETDRPVIVYNIPYRTGVNLHNRSLFELVERNPQIVGVKDSSGDIHQTLELLREGRGRLSVLTGEDQLFFASVALGAAGGIVAAAHVAPELFVRTFHLLSEGDLRGARSAWDDVAPWIPLLYRESNPAPLKAWLADQGLIRSPECRLPLVPASAALRDELRLHLPHGSAPSEAGFDGRTVPSRSPFDDAGRTGIDAGQGLRS